MTTAEIRSKYLEFFQARGHKVIPRARIVPEGDPTTLFTGSGMQPLLPYLLGQKHPQGQRLVDSQPCFRAEDINEVGDNRHTTFFEMLGNWSLGDYFKQEHLSWFWQFLTDPPPGGVGLDPQKLYVTVFSGDRKNNIPKDTESAAIWKGLFEAKKIQANEVEFGTSDRAAGKGTQKGRIFYYDASKNWWSRVGGPDEMPAGEPGGPDSEVFYEFTSVKHDPQYGKHCHPNCDCGRFLEIGNSVFMQYVKTENGFKELPQKNVDFGGGLERIAMAKLDAPDIFRISVIRPVIEKLEQITKKPYQEHAEAMRIIADHLRAVVFLAADGVIPSNKAQGYVMRRFARRAVRQGLTLDIQGDLFKRLAPVIFGVFQDAYPEIGQAKDTVQVLIREESVFRQTLNRGLREFKKLAASKLDGKTIFRLFDTYGFPPELSIEEAERQQLAVADNWRQAFDKEMAAQRKRSRTAAKGLFHGGLADHSEQTVKYHTATHILYKALRMVLGDHVMQRGSNITSERLRFDFSHPQKMTPSEIRQVEDIVNEQIKKDLKVSWQELPTKEALKRGAFGAFGDKYGDKVKVYTVAKEGEKPYSFEICGGPHVEHTGVLAEGGKHFKIIKEESSAAGIRRIKAVLE
ncbi:alanine--tRNA ligase [Candidatus Microgenomates bacterium]|nr:alanine--tRNA ligase [Candidatus Microgenomates bacterium]